LISIKIFFCKYPRVLVDISGY